MYQTETQLFRKFSVQSVLYSLRAYYRKLTKAAVRVHAEVQWLSNIFR